MYKRQVQAQKREAVFQPENLYPTEEGMQNRAAVQKTEEKSVEQENQEKMSVPGLVAAGHYAEIDVYKRQKWDKMPKSA